MSAIDPDVDLRSKVPPYAPKLLAVIAAGGVIGALARYGLSTAWPHASGAFPWATWTINVTGCFLIGVLVAVIGKRWPRQQFIRPFFGTGILGGYTTFSTAAVDVYTTHPPAALLYLGGTLVGALLAVWAGTVLAERVVR